MKTITNNFEGIAILGDSTDQTFSSLKEKLQLIGVEVSSQQAKSITETNEGIFLGIFIDYWGNGLWEALSM